MLSTAFNCLRAMLTVLTKDLLYITEEQSRLVEQLIDFKDVYVGAVYEVFLENEDLEDLTHSLLSLLLKTNDKPPSIALSVDSTQSVPIQSERTRSDSQHPQASQRTQPQVQR